MKTFLDIRSINESKEGYEALRDLNRIHKLELEIQDIQKTVVELLDRLRKYKLGSKEREKITERILKFLQEKEGIREEMEYEMRIFRRSISSMDMDGSLNIDELFN